MSQNRLALDRLKPASKHSGKYHFNLINHPGTKDENVNAIVCVQRNIVETNTRRNSSQEIAALE